METLSLMFGLVSDLLTLWGPFIIPIVIVFCFLKWKVSN